MVLLILAEPYRIRRVTSFWNPWEDPFGSGYQLTQSLMAFGRGEVWGQGRATRCKTGVFTGGAHRLHLLHYWGRTGLYRCGIGAINGILRRFPRHVDWPESAGDRSPLLRFLACSIGIWFSFRALVNVGAAAGMLPTKGLTLPLISYGGSSLLIMSTAIMFLLRIDYETRLEKAQAFTRGSR